MTDAAPDERGVVAGRPGRRRPATPSFAARRRRRRPARRLGADRDRRPDVRWGERTFVMGILNVDARTRSPATACSAAAGRPGRPRPSSWRRADGRRGRRPPRRRRRIDPAGPRAGRRGARRLDRVVPVVAALRAALPGRRRSASTRRSPSVAAAALDAGADLVNDVWGVGRGRRAGPARGRARRPDRPDAQPRRRPRYDEPHGRGRRRTSSAAIERALGAGVPLGATRSSIPGFGFGKTPDHNLALLRDLGGAARPGPADPARDVAQVDARPGPRPAARRAARGDPRHDRARDRRRRRHRPRPRRPRRTSGPPGWPTRSSAADRRPTAAGWEARDERPDRAPQHGVPGPPRRARAGAARAPAVPGRRRAASSTSSRPASTTTSRRRSTTAVVFETVPEIVESTSVPAPRGARRGDRPRAPRRLPGRRGRSSGSASRTSRSSGTLDYAGVEIRRRRPAELPRTPDDAAVAARGRHGPDVRSVHLDGDRLAVAEDAQGRPSGPARTG